MQKILGNVEDESGMIGFAAFVGPQPIYGGKLGVMT